MATIRCSECIVPDDDHLISKAFSDAEWHNTVTGHDVMVIGTNGVDAWELTDAGWDTVDDELSRVRFGTEL